MIANPALARRHLWLVALAVIAVQAALVATTMPLGAIGSSASLWYIDHPYHLYQIELGRALLAHGSLIGYDPFFGAGHIGGVSFNASARVPVLLSALVPASLPTATLYAAYVFACATFAPALAVWFAGIRRWSTTQSVLAGATALVFWWCGAFRWYHTAGLVSFVFCCYLAIAYAAWIWRLCAFETERVAIRVVAAGILGGCGCWFHPLFALVVVFVFGAFLAVEWRTASWTALIARGTAIVVVVALLESPWVIAMMQAPSIVADQPYQRSVGLAVFVQPLLGLWKGMGMPLNPVCLVVAIIGLVIGDPRRRATGLALMLAGLAALLFCAFGAAIAPVAALQPNRFVAPAFLLIALAAAGFVGDALTRWHRPVKLRSIVALAALVVVAGYATVEVAREVDSGPHGHYGKRPPEMTATPKVVDDLAAWLRTNTSRDGRVLMESSLGRVYGGGHVAGLLARMTDREFIGAAYPFSQPRLSFWDGVGFGKPLAELTTDEFAAGLDLYNVGWIVAHSAGLQAYVDSSGQGDRVARFGDVVVFRLHRSLSFVATGRARIEARSFDRVDVADASGSELVLKYVWVPGLSVTAPARLEPAPMGPDLPPLIRVVGAPPRFSISMCARCVAAP